jgi:hypothetical protein
MATVEKVHIAMISLGAGSGACEQQRRTAGGDMTLLYWNPVAMSEELHSACGNQGSMMG